jgi:arylsulfatase A-like enzyme
MVIVIGDNGTYAQSVKAPFDIQHAKGFVNQTGVWVPLIVSGPLVDSPDRDVQSMVNVADLFQLFGEIAGLDVRKIVPQSHILDSVSMLPYLTNPSQRSLRAFNFTQTGINISAHNERPGPCVIPIPSQSPTCVQSSHKRAFARQRGANGMVP